MSSIDQLLILARERVSKTTYKIVNNDTGCYGIAVQATPGSQSSLTIHHGPTCGCLDIHMIDIRKHVKAAYRRRGIRKAQLDDLIMAFKLRLPNVGFNCRMRCPRKPIDPREADDQPIRIVEETKGGQVLIEMWDSVEAWRTRTIWKDW